MVRKYSKEYICDWFKMLEAPERIELMCGLVQHCHPLEVRFLGTCIEEMARKDFLAIRTDENNANKSEVLEKLKDFNDRQTRSKLIVYLSLLHSSNSHCASIYYEILNSADLSPLTKSFSNISVAEYKQNRKLLEESILAYTLAANHPAFKIAERQILRSKVEALKRLMKHYILMDSRRNMSCDDDQIQNTCPLPLWVTNIEVLKFEFEKRGSTSNTLLGGGQFHLNVSWSDGSQKEIIKSQTDMRILLSNLMMHHPVEMANLIQEFGVPSNEIAIVDLLIPNIHKLPYHILSSDIILKAFELPEQTQPSFYIPTSPASSSSCSSTSSSSSTTTTQPELEHLTKSNKNIKKQNSKDSILHIQANCSPNRSTPSPSSSMDSMTKHSILYEFLKMHRLQKYHSKLKHLTIEELKKKTSQDLQSIGITVGASDRIYKLFQDKIDVSSPISNSSERLVNGEIDLDELTLQNRHSSFPYISPSATLRNISNSFSMSNMVLQQRSNTSSSPIVTSSHQDSPVVMISPWPRPQLSNGLIPHQQFANNLQSNGPNGIPFSEFMPLYIPVYPPIRRSPTRPLPTQPIKQFHCYNCGDAGHSSNNCPNKNMDDLTTTSRFHLNFKDTT